MADYSSFGLKDKIAIVTGASQGIGRAIAIGLAEAGCHVVLAKYPGPRMDDIHEVQRQIELAGRRALIVPTDVNVVAEVNALMDITVREFGRIDILVNNASWTGTGDALDVTEEEYDKTFDATVKSVFFASQAAGRVMLKQKAGELSRSAQILEKSLSRSGRSMRRPKRRFTIWRGRCRSSGRMRAFW